MIIGKSETATRLLVHRAKQNIKSFLCRNCSLYHPGNPCRCENLIEFSLKQGWIQKAPAEAMPQPQVTALEIEKEIDDLKRVTRLYAGLNSPHPTEDMICAMRQKIENAQHQIFSR